MLFVESQLTFQKIMWPSYSGLKQETGMKIEKRHVIPKRPLTFNGLHGVISQKLEFFYS
jgi:hypothetical protein